MKEGAEREHVSVHIFPKMVCKLNGGEVLSSVSLSWEYGKKNNNVSKRASTALGQDTGIFDQDAFFFLSCS